MAMEQHNSVLLPADVIETILSRLSVKSLLRFKSVSKSWNTIISDPVFIRNHHHRSNKSQTIFISMRVKSSSNSNSEDFSLVKFEDKKFKHLRVLNGPSGNWSTVLCSYNGVLLLLDFRGPTTLALWNPSTRTQIFIPLPYQSNGYPLVSFGLCHDPTVGDFKVVLISYDYYLVFSCKNESWTRKKAFGDHRKGFFTCGLCVSLDGVVYWYLDHKGCQEIIYLDPRDDELKILQKPKELEAIKRFDLVDFRGCLCLYGNGGDETKVEMWVKEKGRDNNSWKELMIIENVDTPVGYYFQLRFFVENKIVIRLDRKLVVYNTGDKTFEKVEYDDDHHVVAPYLDSLFFPPFENHMRDRNRSKSICFIDG